MSEDNRATPEAVTNEPSGSQTTQDQAIRTTEVGTGEVRAEAELAETWPEAEPDNPGAAEGDDEDRGESDRPRKKSKSERLRQQNERLRAELAQLKSGSVPSTVQDGAAIEAAVTARIGEAPREADFSDWFDYQTAKTAYDLDRRQVSRQIREGAEQAQAARSERIRDLADDYQDNMAALTRDVPDLVEVLGKASYQPTPLIESLILEAGEKAPLVAYFLAKNPRMAAGLNALSPLEAAREIGRIEGKVSAPKPRTITGASPPISPLKGGASPTRSLGKSMSDYERWRNS